VFGWLLLSLLPPPPADARTGGFGWPLRPRPPVVRRFDKPAYDWLPGHRGVDLGGAAGQAVLTTGDGYVAFAGRVAGKPVVSVEHPGGLRTTYEPVRASVAVGRRVIRGDVLGVLEPGHCAEPCLHWGARRGHDYLDPLGLIHHAPLRLKPVRPDG
jgi:murein DD-endopeptidase MepM/ murein hydrolase activator NlpD